MKRFASEGAAHILAAAHRRFDFAVAVGALRNLDFITVGQFQRSILKGGVTVATGGIDAHSAFLAFISSHGSSLSIDGE